ncbi:MAG: TIGR03617 family F420-dependent LLM class oxidoreductase [Pseudomonadales bacterium]|nr:TIGR03617 family F420-dependent LLM class oxidoreductase [Pseudomonadales bacterium]
MKIDSSFSFGDRLDDIGVLQEQFRRREQLGFDGVVTAEIRNDPFVVVGLGAAVTERVELRTGIAVAFARSPMTTAYSAHDLNVYSRGRFTLGLGSQIQAHITKRFGMPWHGPAKQMAEFIRALHAIWDCWYDGKPLNFRGDCYRHTLMTPDFTPHDTRFGRPRVVMAAVGPLMIATAAREADGILVHTFCTPKYLEEEILPRIAATLAESGRSRADFEVSFPPFVVTGATEAEFEAAKQQVKYRIAFYGSTPAYRPVLECHGWGDLQPKLNQLSKNNGWERMPELIGDEMLETFAVVGEPRQVATEIRRRYGHLVDRLTLENTLPDDQIAEQLRVIRG